MRTLIVFDDETAPTQVAAVASNATQVDLFPLSSSWARLEAVEQAARRQTEGLHVLDSARLVDREVEALRERLPAWSQALGAASVEGRSVASWMSRGEGRESAYWFGSIGEKNPLKTPELFLVAQVRALDQQLARERYDECWILRAAPLARRTMTEVARARGVATKGAASTSTRSLLRGIRSWMEGTGGLGVAVAALLAWTRCGVWGMAARGLTFRQSDGTEPPATLFVTYFPYVDRTEAVAGRFVNRYTGPLQAQLSSGGTVWWLGLFVFIDGRGFRDAAALARRFVAAGERLALLEAYGTPLVLFRVLAEWVRLRRRARWLRRTLGDLLSEGLLPPGAERLGERLWRRSYEGIDLMRGLYYAATCERAVADAEHARRCVYLCEMQTWEHALVSAARRAGIPTLGYQHTSVSRNYYFYRQADGQLDDAPTPDGLAVPDRLAANGERPRNLLAESGYPGLVEAESVRYLGLRDALATDRPARGDGPPVVLVAGSIVRQETAALLSLVVAAWPPSEPDDTVTLWLKGHPSQPIDVVAEQLGLRLDARYVIKDGDIGALLPRVDLVVVPTSAVSIEALAYGCEVVVPVFSTFPAMTPLAGFDDYYRRVHTPGELREVVAGYRRHGPSVALSEKRAFVRSYWCLDPDLPRWRQLLGLAAVGSDQPAFPGEE